MTAESKFGTERAFRQLPVEWRATPGPQSQWVFVDVDNLLEQPHLSPCAYYLFYYCMHLGVVRLVAAGGRSTQVASLSQFQRYHPLPSCLSVGRRKCNGAHYEPK